MSPHHTFDLLSAKQHFAPAGGPRKRRVRLILLLVLATVVIAGLLVYPLYTMSLRVYAHADAGKAQLSLAEEAASRLDLRVARSHTDAAADEFVAARADLDRYSAFRHLPLLGPQLDAADRVLASGTVTISALDDVMDVAEEILAVATETQLVAGQVEGVIPDLSTAFSDLTQEQKGKILDVFQASEPRIRDAFEKVDGALMSVDDLMEDPAVASGFRDALQPVRDRLVAVDGGLRLLYPATQVLPALLGHPQTKTYLAFFQNNTELRPTGGFLGVVGIIRLKDGELISAETDDVYAYDAASEDVERPAPPAPIAKYIGVDQWYLRDANWSPDFTVSAEVMRRFFDEEAALALPPEQRPVVDGTIAVTPQLAIDVLHLTGPITVDGVTFDAENLVDELEYQVELGYARKGIPSGERKDIIKDLLEEMIARVSAFPLSDLMLLGGRVQEDLLEGHILFAFDDPVVQRVVLENDWGGKLHPVRSDYLSVIDANLASLKSDPAVRRSIDYGIVRAEDGRYEATVTITYDHRGGFDWKTTRYRTYTRVYVPAGSELLRVQGAMENDKLKDPARKPGVTDVYDELDRRAFGAFISIEPGETRSLSFTYRLSPSVVAAVDAGEYSLYVEKQPGTDAHGLTLDLDFGKTLTGAEPSEEPSQIGDARYRLTSDLRIDREFTVRLRR